jgi:hypothetical protein
LPPNFQWSSSGVLISPKPDATHHIVSIKDPSVVRYNNRWIVYATTANTAAHPRERAAGSRTGQNPAAQRRLQASLTRPPASR